MTTFNFVNGKAIVKSGRKVIAKVYDREVFYTLNKIKSGFSFPYSLEISGGVFECSSLEEVKKIFYKYI